MIAFLTACGGGIIRDISLGAVPPAGIQNWQYLAITFLAVANVIVFKKLILKLNFPILIFDALGLSLFSVAGTQKSLMLGFNYQVAILLGVLSAIGGGVLRDVLLGKIPTVFRKEIYASAALLGSSIYAISFHFQVPPSVGTWVGVLACFLLRFVSIRNKWNLPTFTSPK
jgi:uncharacterized membrane protein YeiH